MVEDVGDAFHLFLVVDGFENFGFQEELGVLGEGWLFKLDGYKLGCIDFCAQEDRAKGARTYLTTYQVLAAHYHVFFKHYLFIIIIIV